MEPLRESFEALGFKDDVAPYFHQLGYTENPHGRAYFNRTHEAIPASNILNDTRVTKLLRNCEPGPSVDYENLRANLIEMNPFLTRAARGPALMLFFSELVSCSKDYMAAAVDYYNYAAYFEEMLVYLSDFPNTGDTDDLLVWHDIRPKWIGLDEQIGVKGLEMLDLGRKVKADLKVKRAALCALKMSDEMWDWSDVLWRGVQQYDSFLWKKEVAEQMKVAKEGGLMQQMNVPNEGGSTDQLVV